MHGDDITMGLVWRRGPLVLVPSFPQVVRTLSCTALILWKHPQGDKTGHAVTLFSRLFTKFQKKSVLPFNLRSHSSVTFANN